MHASALDLCDPTFVDEVAALVRSARETLGWSQRRLASLAGVSQAAVWRLETRRPGPVDLVVVQRVLSALGLHATVSVNDLAIRDRERQRDALHAVLNGFVARRLVVADWATETEVQLGSERPRGWIDTWGWRPADRSLFVEETKCDLPDFGALQRRLGFYEREARKLAASRGWRPARVVVAVVALDTATIAERLRDNRDLLRVAFPGDAGELAAWLADPAAPAPGGWTFAMADPATRGSTWLRAVPLGSRRQPPAYPDYAAAAQRLLRGRVTRR